jgi:hypothetical protein
MSTWLTATFLSAPVSVGSPTEEEAQKFAGAVEPVAARDHLDCWNLVVIREQSGPRLELHCLGWRSALGNTWITSPLVRIDLTAGLVATFSKHVYVLGRRDEGLDDCMRQHLLYALRTWGCDNVKWLS